MKRVGQLAQDMSDQLKGMSTDGVLKRVKHMVMDAKDEIVQLPSSKTPNYKVSAAASVAFGVLYMVSSFDCGSLSIYLSMAGCALTATMAVNQYGVTNIYHDASNRVMGFFKPATKSNEAQVTFAPQEEDRSSLRTRVQMT